MAQDFQIPSGEKKEFISGLYSVPTENTTPEHDKILIMMLHGFPGVDKKAHQDLFGDLEFLFTSSGFHTLRFDFRCCGSSEGLQEDFTLKKAMVDIDTVLDWAQKQGFEEIIYVAEGLGAAICLPKINDQTKLAFFFWPILDLPGFAQEKFSKLDLSTDTKHTAHIHFNNSRVGLPLIEEMKTAKLGKNMEDIKIPLLVQYGSDDDMVADNQIEYLRNNLKAPRMDITSYQNGKHGLTDERERKMIFYHIGQFLTKYT